MLRQVAAAATAARGIKLAGQQVDIALIVQTTERQQFSRWMHRGHVAVGQCMSIDTYGSDVKESQASACDKSLVLFQAESCGSDSDSSPAAVPTLWFSLSDAGWWFTYIQALKSVSRAVRVTLCCMP